MASRDLADLNYRRIVILLVSLVVVPTFLLVSLGVICCSWAKPSSTC
jgi:hypothetical protein